MRQISITTNKISKETEQQYTAWLLYCEAGSIRKLLRQWKALHQGFIKTSSELEPLAVKLGKPPSERTLLEWSRKYQWVKRTDLKLAEDLEVLREKIKKVKREKLHKIAEAFEKIANKILKRLREGEEPTINEWKQVWEMLQVELGKPITRAALNEEQRPLTEEEKKQKKKIDAALKKYIESDEYRKDKDS